MSRAFMKEREDAPEPAIESHVAGVPVPVTAAGRAMLEERLDRSSSPAERKRLEKLVPDLIVPDPPADRGVVAFGAQVEIVADIVGRRQFKIVGPDETDAAAGRISPDSPLGSALLGARAGDVVRWHRPAGDVDVTIAAIAYEAPPR